MTFERGVYASFSDSEMLAKVLDVVTRGAWVLDGHVWTGAQPRVTTVTYRDGASGVVEIRSVLHYGTMTRRNAAAGSTNGVLVTSLGFSDGEKGPNPAFPEFGECIVDAGVRRAAAEREGREVKAPTTLESMREAYTAKPGTPPESETINGPAESITGARFQVFAETPTGRIVLGVMRGVDLQATGLKVDPARMYAERDRVRHVLPPVAERSGCLCDKPHKVLGVRVFRDGDQWCALFGQNIQEGCAGFGATRVDACAAFDRAWSRWHVNGYAGKLGVEPFPEIRMCDKVGPPPRVSVSHKGCTGYGWTLEQAAERFHDVWERHKARDSGRQVPTVEMLGSYSRAQAADRITHECLAGRCECNKPHAKLRPLINANGVYFNRTQNGPFTSHGQSPELALAIFDGIVGDFVHGNGGVLGTLRLYPYPTVSFPPVAGGVKLSALYPEGVGAREVAGIGRDIDTAEREFFRAWDIRDREPPQEETTKEEIKVPTARVLCFKASGKFYHEFAIPVTLEDTVKWWQVCARVRAMCNPQRLPGLIDRAHASGYTVLVMPPEGADYGFPSIVYKPDPDVN